MTHGHAPSGLRNRHTASDSEAVSRICNDRVAPTFKAVDAYGQLLVELMAVPMAGADDSYYSTTFRVSSQQAPTIRCQLWGLWYAQTTCCSI